MPCCTRLTAVSTKKGNQGEDAACRYLKRHGYDILDRNRRIARGELDIVAKCDELLVFVEVKTYQQRESALMAMHADKCERFVSAAQAWLGLHQQYAQLQCRFDLMLVKPRKLGVLPASVEHVLDIIRL